MNITSPQKLYHLLMDFQITKHLCDPYTEKRQQLELLQQISQKLQFLHSKRLELRQKLRQLLDDRSCFDKKGEMGVVPSKFNFECKYFHKKQQSILKEQLANQKRQNECIRSKIKHMKSQFQQKQKEQKRFTKKKARKDFENYMKTINDRSRVSKIFQTTTLSQKRYQTPQQIYSRSKIMHDYQLSLEKSNISRGKKNLSPSCRICSQQNLSPIKNIYTTKGRISPTYRSIYPMKPWF